jgi:hypothetical protein
MMAKTIQPRLRRGLVGGGGAMTGGGVTEGGGEDGGTASCEKGVVSIAPANYRKAGGRASWFGNKTLPLRDGPSNAAREDGSSRVKGMSHAAQLFPSAGVRNDEP